MQIRIITFFLYGASRKEQMGLQKRHGGGGGSKIKYVIWLHLSKVFYWLHLNKVHNGCTLPYMC